MDNGSSEFHEISMILMFCLTLFYSIKTKQNRPWLFENHWTDFLSLWCRAAACTLDGPPWRRGNLCFLLQHKLKACFTIYVADFTWFYCSTRIPTLNHFPFPLRRPGY